MEVAVAHSLFDGQPNRNALSGLDLKAVFLSFFLFPVSSFLPTRFPLCQSYPSSVDPNHTRRDHNIYW